MSAIKPISDLRNNFKKISNIVNRHNEAVVLTKNGESNMVVMSYEHYKRLKTRLGLYETLAIAESEQAAGAPTYDLGTVIDEIKEGLSGSRDLTAILW